MRHLRPLALLLVPALFCAAGCDDGSGGEPATDGTTAATSTGSQAESTTSSISTTGPGPETSATASTSIGSDPTATGDVSTTTSGSSEAGDDSSTGTPADPPPPVGEVDLLPWLEAGNYSQWAAEAEQHPSAGPHFVAVRTFMNETLLEALEGGSEDHPVGSAVVKELYGDAREIGGWAVMIKTAPGSSVDSWYWYEWFTGTTYADDNGVNGCGNCHGLGIDFVRTELPL